MYLFAKRALSQLSSVTRFGNLVRYIYLTTREGSESPVRRTAHSSSVGLDGVFPGSKCELPQRVRPVAVVVNGRPPSHSLRSDTWPFVARGVFGNGLKLRFR